MDKNLETKLVSKRRFYEQQEKVINHMTTEKINDYYAKGKTRTKLFFAEVGLWIGLSLILISTLIFSIFLLIMILNKDNNFAKKLNEANSKIIWFSILGAFELIGIMLFSVGIKNKKTIKKEIVKKFNAYDLYKYVFKYFGLEERFNRDEQNNIIPKYEQINFYRNIKNFKDLPNGSLAISGKYQIYDLVTEDQYIKAQNLEYFLSKWYDLRFLNKKEAKKILSKKNDSYLNQVEIREINKKFGMAIKLRNLKENINLTLFDKDNLYSPETYTFIENVDKKYDDLILKTEDEKLLMEWINENNLAFLEAIKNELNSYKYENEKKNLINNLSLLIRNQEAFIWFNSKYEILDLNLNLKSINRNKVIKTFVLRIIDDIYLIYLLLQLLIPFGLKLKDVQIQEEKQIDHIPLNNEEEISTKNDEKTEVENDEFNLNKDEKEKIGEE